MANDIITATNPDFEKAVDQVIIDSERLHTVVNGSGTESAVTEDGSLIPSVRKSLLDNLYFKSPLPWKMGTQVREFNQLYAFTNPDGTANWWYAPGATQSKPVTMRDSPLADANWKVFLDSRNLSNIYAPILSPDFKGNPRVPTPAAGDISSTIPNTAWVKTAIATAIDIALPNWDDATFTNITVLNNAVLKNLRASGDVTFLGQKVDAVDATVRAKVLTMVGSAAAISFDWANTGATGFRTNLSPDKIYTTTMTANEIVGTHIASGAAGDVTERFRSNGVANMDSVVIRKNNKQDPASATLSVPDGLTVLKDLTVTGTVVGINANVDGTSISPASVNTAGHTNTNTLTVDQDFAVNGKSQFAGDVEFTGVVKGLGNSLIGTEVQAKSLTLDENLRVGGTAEVIGKTTLNDVEFRGAVTGLTYPEPDFTGKEISADYVRTTRGADLKGTATIENLVVTGNITGVDAGTVDDIDIKPKTVTTTGDVTVGGKLILNGPIDLVDVDATTIKSQTLQVTGTTTLNNLAVTGTVTGLGDITSGADLAPNSITSVEDVTVGRDLIVNRNASVGSKLTVHDLEVTGAATGITVDLTGKDISVKDITANSLNTTANVTAQDVMVRGKLLDGTGQDFALSVSASQIAQAITTVEIQPKGVTTKTDTGKGQVSTGDLYTDNATVTQTLTANILAIQSGTVEHDLMVKGNVVDGAGVPIIQMDIPAKIEGKDIAPRKVTASGDITTATMIKGKSAEFETLTAEQGITAGGELSTRNNFSALGSASIGMGMSVQGTSTVEKLVVTGELVDGQGNPIGSVESITGKDIAPRDVTATGDVSVGGGMTVTGTIAAGGLSVTGGEVNIGPKLKGTSAEFSGDGKFGTVTSGGYNGTGLSAPITTTGNISTSNGNISTEKNLVVKENSTFGHVDAGFDGDRITVVGNGRINGNLYVTGLINGSVDLTGVDVEPRNISASGTLDVQGKITGVDAAFSSAVLGADNAATGLTLENNAIFKKDVSIAGKLTANLDDTKDYTMKSLTLLADMTAIKYTGETMTLTGATLDAVNAAIKAKSVAAAKFTVIPKSDTPSNSYVPDGTRSLYNVAINQNTVIEAPSGLLASGQGGSILMYLTQDATGGRTVTFSSNYVNLGSGEVNKAPNSVTVVQIMYRGVGNIIDLMIAPRP